MKNLVADSLKLFTLVGCVFVMFSCGSNNCQTCTKDGETDVEICEDDYPNDVLNAAYNLAITSQEADGWACAE